MVSSQILWVSNLCVLTLTTTLNHITCKNTFGQGFKKDAIRYQCSLKIALIANRVFSKTCLEVFIQLL